MKARVILLRRTDGRESFMVRLSEKGKKAYKKIEVPFNSKVWNYNPKKKKNELKVVTPRDVGRYKTYKIHKAFIDGAEKKYQKQIDVLILTEKHFSFQKVMDLVDIPLEEQSLTVQKMFLARIKELKENDKFGNAIGYKGTYNKLIAFSKKDMLFVEMDTNFLLKFKVSMIKEDMSRATISIHLRTIRALYNYAIKKGIANRVDYPFDDGEVMKELKTGYRSRAVSKITIDKIREEREKFEVGDELWEACNYFIFGYVGRGINFTDIVRLKWSNYTNGRITFVRRKTRSKIDEETSFAVTDELKQIIDWYKDNNIQSLGSPYIFPVLNGFHNTEKKIFNRIKKIRKIVNENLKAVGEKVGAEIPLTTYTWRHSFASVAKNEMKIDVAMISEMLGHHDLETTKHYLKSFPDTALDEATAGM